MIDGNLINNKRIAKNTFVLYIRMAIVMIVGLYTSRIVLQALGINDFGLYNVVGGVVALFTFLRTSMEKCTQRFLNVAMAQTNRSTEKIFSVAAIIHICMAVIAFILAEIVGLWFLNTYVQIPEGRVFAANCIYQTVVGGLVLTILTIPYSACIIANEKMGVFALISIVDCFLNLLIAILLLNNDGDRLILYGILVLLAGLVNFLCYVFYCRVKFPETKLVLVKELSLYKEMLSYTSWTLLGHALIIGTNQGNIILVNIFHGVAANAAMGVANQVNRQVLNLTNNFQTAFNPQITKAYATGNFDYLKQLIYSTSKLSFYLLSIVSIPLSLNIDVVLNIWLKEVPQYSNIFCILMLSSGILQALSAPLNFCIMATGRIKWFQIITGVVFVSDLVVLYGLFSLGFPPTTAMWVKVSIMTIIVYVRMYFAQKELSCISYVDYFRKVIVPICISTSICIVIAIAANLYVHNILSRIIATLVVIILCIVTVYYIGLNKIEKGIIVKLINRNKK